MEADIQKALLHPCNSDKIERGVVASRPPNPPIASMVPASIEKFDGAHIVIKTNDPIKQIEQPNPIKIRAINKP